MNKKFATQILTEVQGTSPSFIKEYGLSLVKEALRYASNLKNFDQYLIDNVSEKISRITN